MWLTEKVHLQNEFALLRVPVYINIFSQEHYKRKYCLFDPFPYAVMKFLEQNTKKSSRSTDLLRYLVKFFSKAYDCGLPNFQNFLRLAERQFSTNIAY